MPRRGSSAEFERVLRQLLGASLGEPLPDFSDRTRLGDDLGLTSLQVATLAQELEHRLGLTRSGNAYSVTELVRVGDLRRIAGQASAEPRAEAPDPLAESLARGAGRRRARRRRG